MSQPLTDAINALTTYANEITGQSDTTLSDAVESLVDGYGGGGDNSKYLDLIAKTGTSFSDDTITEIGRSVFSYWTTLETLSMPNLTTITDSVFQGCSKITNFYFPKLTTITSGNCFNSAGTSTSTIILPSISSIPSMNAFNSFKGKAIDLDGSLSNLNTYTFNNCSALETIILRKNSVVDVNNVNAFNNSPFASGKTGGTLYVPRALISSYQSANVWSTILGYSTNSIQAIEGSVYENTYADGTPISTT